MRPFGHNRRSDQIIDVGENAKRFAYVEEEPLLQLPPDKKVEISSLNQGSDMHIITRKRLNAFAARDPETRSALEHWYREMKRRNCVSFADLRSIFPAADRVGKRTVFNIGGIKAAWWQRCIIIDVDCIFVPC